VPPHVSNFAQSSIQDGLNLLPQTLSALAALPRQDVFVDRTSVCSRAGADPATGR